MLPLLSSYLSQFESAFQVFQYLTLRGILAAGTALVISLLVGRPMIRRLNHYQVGQSVRDDGPQTHLGKTGTPTMGGALILVAIAVATLLWGDLTNPYLWVALLVTGFNGAQNSYDLGIEILGCEGPVCVDDGAPDCASYCTVYFQNCTGDNDVYAGELGEPFTTAGFCLYRDGADSVAWHGDTIGVKHADTVVAIVSVGSARPLLLRPRGGGSRLSFPLGHGDLLVMGGTCQRTWEHAVPKVRAAGPRMSIQFRRAGVA